MSLLLLGILLVIPKRHVKTYFDLVLSELNAVNALLTTTKADIEKKDSEVKGFNVGMNNGVVAGQTIYHCHIHLIPRREGDVESPQGGVRRIIPGNGSY